MPGFSLVKLIRWVSNIAHTPGRGVFPHEMSLLLEPLWRNILLLPQKLAARLTIIASSRVLEVGAGSGQRPADASVTGPPA
jgi:hypothetical protein